MYPILKVQKVYNPPYFSGSAPIFGSFFGFFSSRMKKLPNFYLAHFVRSVKIRRNSAKCAVSGILGTFGKFANFPKVPRMPQNHFVILGP